MAISKASSQKMTASQVTKKPLNDLMDAIKDASAKGQKKTDFKNFLIDPVAHKTVEPNKTQTQNKSDGSKKDLSNQRPMTQQADRTVDKEKAQYTESNKETDPEVISESEIDLDECTTLIQKEPDLNNFIQIKSQPEIIQLQEQKSAQSQSVHMKEHDIQEWIQEGRVKIELVTEPNQEPMATHLNLAQHSTVEQQAISQDGSDKNDVSYNQETLMNNEPDLFGGLNSSPSRAHEIQQVNPQMPSPVVQPIAAQTEFQPLQKGTSQQNGLDLKVSATNTSSIKGTKVATLTTLDKLNALNQIKEQLKQSLQKGETHLKIQLKPHEMGKVDIKLDISREGLVTAAFKAENRETLETLTRHAIDFQNIFNEAGLQADSQGMNFSMSRGNRDEQNSFGEMLAAEAIPELEEVKAINSGLLPSSQINILT